MVDADIDIDPEEMELDEPSREWLESDDADPTNRRNVEIFTEFSRARAGGQEQEDRDALPPLPGRDPGGRQGRADRRRPQRAPARRVGRGSARVDTGERETIECGLVLRSIGYKGIPLEGVPFDERPRR